MTDKTASKKPPVLHLYGQDTWHSDAFIVAEKDALLALRVAIDAALECGVGKAALSPNDGEGYYLHVVLKECMERMSLPYPGWEKGRDPWSLVKFREEDEILSDDEWFEAMHKFDGGEP